MRKRERECVEREEREREERERECENVQRVRRNCVETSRQMRLAKRLCNFLDERFPQQNFLF